MFGSVTAMASLTIDRTMTIDWFDNEIGNLDRTDQANGVIVAYVYATSPFKVLSYSAISS